KVHFLLESYPSSYAARNLGVLNATGEVIAFTDADCIPHENWIENGVKNLKENPGLGLLAGKINVFFRDSDNPGVVEIYERLMAFQQDYLIKKGNFCSTSNLFTYREVFDDIGLFKSTLKSGGDREWGRRVFSAGYIQSYAEDVCIEHPARYSLKQLLQRNERISGGLHDINTGADSKLQGIILEIKDILFELPPPIRRIKKIFYADLSLPFQRRLQLILILFVVKYSRTLTRVRLLFGGNTARS
ncbi:MAG: glycosyltransferase family A protein, partial [Cyanobacteria bacterium J06635_10]